MIKPKLNEQLVSPMNSKVNFENVCKISVVNKLINLRNEVNQFIIELAELCKAH